MKWFSLNILIFGKNSTTDIMLHTLFFQVQTLKDLRFHPQDYFSVCILKGKLLPSYDQRVGVLMHQIVVIFVAKMVGL